MYCFEHGIPLCLEELARVVQILDLDKSGRIDAHEFAAWWEKKDRYEYHIIL